MNKDLSVLLACPRSGNPYVSELVRYLNGVEGLSCTHSHAEFFTESLNQYDVVHIQWPEALFGWNAPITADDLELLNNRLVYCRDHGIKVVLTVHNERPHTSNGNLYSALYDCVYRHADGYVHLAQASIDLLQNGESVSASARHFMIPHGNYGYFRELASETSTGLPSSGKFRVLCFGAVRKPSEIKIICKVADVLSELGGELVVAGRILSGSRRKLHYYRMKVPLLFRKNIRKLEGKIPDPEVAALVSSCDAMLIPRVDTLNSGNVALGLTFGKVVLGPRIGNIGEELSNLGNPTFDPSDLSTLRTVVRDLKEKAHTDLGRKNRVYSDTTLNWNNVARLHRQMYQVLQDS